MTHPAQFRAGSGVRTLLVASATLGILIVAFLIYELGHEKPSAVVKERIAEIPSVTSEALDLPVPDRPGEASAAETMAIGRGEKITITLYPREGTQATMELAVADLKPIAGSANEFLLTKPDVRMRTRDGHAVCMTAERGTLEAERTRGSGLQPIRGRLVQNVVVQYDRLTQAQREALPDSRRDEIDPNDLILVEVEEIEFDLEYSKLIAPGPIEVTARDMHMAAFDLEVRFDESTSRVDSVRLQRGGRIEFLETGGAPPSPGDSQFTYAQWLRSSLGANEAQPQGGAGNVPDAPEPPDAGDQAASGHGDETIPAFPTREAARLAPKPPVRCLGLIEGDVRATRYVEDGEQTRLEADRLEIIRDVARGGESVRPSAGESVVESKGSDAALPRIVLEWSHQLTIDPCEDGDARCEAPASSVVAFGEPAVIQTTEGFARCRRVAYDPMGGTVDLSGGSESPVVVVLEGQGVLTAVAVHSQRVGEETRIRVTGPGFLERMDASSAMTNRPGAPDSQTAGAVQFAETLDVYLRPESSASGGGRVIERATFSGDVRMRDASIGLDTDRLDLAFRAPKDGTESAARIERATARGHVVLTSGEDRLSCRELDAQMRPDPANEMRLGMVTAYGDVVAEQGTRLIRARDRLIVDFETDAARPVDRARRVRAFGDVVVRDPGQQLEIDAEQLDCTLAGGANIETAAVSGDTERPAWLRFETLSVWGGSITFDAKQERADVPGAGRLTLLTDRGLDGRRVSPPEPVDVTWTDSMNYRGIENRAVFSGDVRAATRDTVRYSSDELVVEFEDGAPAFVGVPTVSSFPKLQAYLAGAWTPLPRPPSSVRGSRFGKEATRILASGRVVATISEFDEPGHKLTTRSRIAGERLWVNLRPEVSKMQIEGAGTLLIEDLRPAAADRATASRVPAGSLFAAAADAGPSNTLVEWRDLMWYDFARHQTRFNGAVSLKHFSGKPLMQIRPGLAQSAADTAPGRATFLTGDALIIDFRGDRSRGRRGNDERIGGISVGRLTQFEAFGSVLLQDEVEGLAVTAQRVVFWNDRDLLGIYAARDRLADIVVRRPGEMPTQMSVERLFYNLRTQDAEVSQPAVRTR